MNKQRSTEIKVGVVTLVSLLLFVLALVFGRGVNLRGSQPTVKMLFPNSGGLELSSPVAVNGVKRGTVTAVEPYNNAVLVTATLDNINDLKKDATARLLMLEITGGKKIEIAPGASADALASGDMIQGKTAADVSELIALVGDVADNAKSIIKKLDTVMTSATELLADGQVILDTKKAMHHLSSVAETADNLLARNRSSLQATFDDLRVLSSDLRNIAHTNGPKVDSLVNRIDKLVVSANKFLGNTEKTMRGADTLIAQINGLVRDVRTNEGGLAYKLVYDKQFTARLDSLVLSLRRILDMDGVNVNVRLGTRP